MIESHYCDNFLFPSFSIKNIYYFIICYGNLCYDFRLFWWGLCFFFFVFLTYFLYIIWTLLNELELNFCRFINLYVSVAVFPFLSLFFLLLFFKYSFVGFKKLESSWVFWLYIWYSDFCYSEIYTKAISFFMLVYPDLFILGEY